MEFLDYMCKECEGTGSIPPHIGRTICPKCNGTGMVGYINLDGREIQCFPTKLGQTLFSVRIRHQLTLRQLSQQIGLSPSRLSEIETGLGNAITEKEENIIREWMAKK